MNPEDLKALSLEDLAALAAEKREALDVLFAVEGTPSDEQITEAEALASDLVAIDAESSEREVAAAAKNEKFAALKAQFADAPPEETPEEKKKRLDEEKAAADEAEQAAAAEAEAEAAAEEEAAAKAAAEAEEAALVAAGKPVPSNIKQAARKTPRPKPPVVEPTSKVTILASADTGFASGTPLTIDEMGVALQNKVSGFSAPSRAMRGADIPMQKIPVAKISFETDDQLVIDNKTTDHMAVLASAVQESRLPEGSLVAAGGWCAPSETIYDLCEGETLEGLYSLPEVTIRRGGINYTKGPQFSDFYGTPWTGGAGFKQTEAQAIAGTTKDCYTISCPPFQEVRMDAVGLCIKVPILTEAGYPELIRRITSGSLTAHQHRLSVEKINRVVALSGAAKDYAVNGEGLGSSINDSLAGLTVIANKRREQFRFGLNSSMEIVLPFWTKDMFKDDLGRRQGRDTPASDTEIMAFFAARNLAVQFVYGWQPLATVLTGTGSMKYPATFQALMYPAGTFVAGVADVINLSAVYDAASLQVNTYTGTFMEQGLLVAEMCYDSDLVTLPTCNAGRSGAADFTCA
jgi:multidrug efflux pump subunit AcrA (membrane-fusion protein)